jgi:hypothetical protein
MQKRCVISENYAAKHYQKCRPSGVADVGCKVHPLTIFESHLILLLISKEPEAQAGHLHRHHCEKYLSWLLYLVKTKVGGRLGVASVPLYSLFPPV